ncbi:MAG: hypothetical protein ABIH10_00895 [Spirochaetota bacterium]
MSITTMVETPEGILEMDVSLENCLAIGGFLANQQLVTPFGENITTLGVAPARLGESGLVMWYQKSSGEVCWRRGRLDELGFEPK